MAIVIFRLPAKFISEEATDSEKEFYKFFKAKSDEINRFGSDLAFVLPSECDPETRKYLFDIEVKGV